jgi:hypothetical protein
MFFSLWQGVAERIAQTNSVQSRQVDEAAEQRVISAWKKTAGLGRGNWLARWGVIACELAECYGWQKTGRWFSALKQSICLLMDILAGYFFWSRPFDPKSLNFIIFSKILGFFG